MTKEGFERQSIGAPVQPASHSPIRDWVGEAMAKREREREEYIRGLESGCPLVVLCAIVFAVFIGVMALSAYWDRWYFQNWLMGGR